eukprot:COSAG04_NODE_365_length_15832_cov_19.821585_3_plen_152_part_00
MNRSLDPLSLGHFSPIFPPFFPVFSPFCPSGPQDSRNRHQDPEKRSETVAKRGSKTVSSQTQSTLTFVIGAAQAQNLDEDKRGRGSLGGDSAQRQIRVALPASVWAPFPDTGQTVFERYDKNVLGLPFIMAGDFFFDDAAMAVRVGERGVG